MEWLADIAANTWQMTVAAAPWLFVGFVAAGLIKAFAPTKMVARWLGGRGPAAVLRASVVGIPLPLCSCGVLPTALGLRRQGAGRPATVSFLVSTPEIGVDSFLLSYALLGPVMAVARPIAAFASAVVAGLSAMVVDRDAPADAAAPDGTVSIAGTTSSDGKATADGQALAAGERTVASLAPPPPAPPPPAPPPPTTAPLAPDADRGSAESDDPCSNIQRDNMQRRASPQPGCCGGEVAGDGDGAAAGGRRVASEHDGEEAAGARDAARGEVSDGGVASCCASPPGGSAVVPDASCCSTGAGDDDAQAGTFWRRLSDGQRYVFTRLLDDISKWLVVAIVVAGLVTTFFDADDLQSIGSGLPAMLIMLVVGVPLYLCATASTPVAAALLMSGVSPGAVLVLLLAGPATNIGAIGVLRRELGAAVLVAYLAAIAVCSVGAGLIVDAVVDPAVVMAQATHGHEHHLFPHWFAVATAAALIALGVRPLRRLLGRALGGSTGPTASCRDGNGDGDRDARQAEAGPASTGSSSAGSSPERAAAFRV